MPGPSVYPNAIDGYAQLPLVVDGVTPVNAYSVNTLRSAILNIELELGINPSGTYEDVAERLFALEQAVGEVTGGELLLGDSIRINFTPSNYTRDSSDTDTTALNQLGSHLLGIDNEIDTIISLIDDVTTTAEAHASRHINGGSDQIDADRLFLDFVPTNYSRDNSIPVSVSQNELSAHLKGIDNAIGSGSGISLPGVTTEDALVRWGDGTPTFTNSTVLLDSSGNLSNVNTAEVGGQTFWGALASDPISASTGDMYYNTAIGMMMYYDSLRSKWLSVESATVQFGRNGPTQAGQYFRGIDGRVLSDSIGFCGLRNGTVVSITYTKSDSNPAIIEVTSNGSQIATLPAASTSGRDLSTNADFNFGDIVSARNHLAGADTEDVQGWLRIKWRT